VNSGLSQGFLFSYLYCTQNRLSRRLIVVSVVLDIFTRMKKQNSTKLGSLPQLLISTRDEAQDLSDRRRTTNHLTLTTPHEYSRFTIYNYACITYARVTSDPGTSSLIVISQTTLLHTTNARRAFPPIPTLLEERNARGTG